MRTICALAVIALIWAATAARGLTEDPQPAVGDSVDRYVVPQGNVPELVKFIHRLAQYKPEEPTDVVEHRTKFRAALQEAAEQILQLEQDHGSEAYEAARFIVLGNRVYWFARVVPEEQRRIVADVRAYLDEALRQGERQGAVAGIAAAAAKIIQQTGQWDWAAESNEAFGTLLEEHNTASLSELAHSMRARAEQLRAMSKDGPKPSVIGVAPRGPITTIDLSKHANWWNTEFWGDSYHGNGLAELPKGDQVLCGVRFCITEKMLQLGYTDLSDAPLHIDGIPVGEKCSRLYVLQATQHWAPDGTAVATYQVHYEDGSAAAIPVVYGLDVRDWWDHDQGRPVTRARVVWTGSNPNSDKTGTTLRLYLGVWENPHPEKTVATLDFVKTEDRDCGPMCLAISAEGE